MKKKAVKKAAKPKAKSKPKAKAKARVMKAKPVAKASKAKVKVKAKATKAPAKAKAAPKEEHGLTVIDLFKMKQQREQEAAQGTPDFAHKKDLPPQDQHQPEDPKGPGNVKKGGFGGARHH